MLVVHKSTPFKLSQIPRNERTAKHSKNQSSSLAGVPLTAVIHHDGILYTHTLILLLTILKVNNQTADFWILYTSFGGADKNLDSDRNRKEL